MTSVMELSEKEIREALKTAWCAGYGAPAELDSQHAPEWMTKDVDDIFNALADRTDMSAKAQAERSAPGAASHDKIAPKSE